jgi:hypothetical protein
MYCVHRYFNTLWVVLFIVLISFLLGYVWIGGKWWNEMEWSGMNPDSIVWFCKKVMNGMECDGTHSIQYHSLSHFFIPPNLGNGMKHINISITILSLLFLFYYSIHIAGSLPFKTRYIIGTPNAEKKIRGLLRLKV